MPKWTDRLARKVRDSIDDVTLETRDDARHYMAALPEQARSSPSGRLRPGSCLMEPTQREAKDDWS
jgi:hypothetical protein